MWPKIWRAEVAYDPLMTRFNESRYGNLTQNKLKMWKVKKGIWYEALSRKCRPGGLDQLFKIVYAALTTVLVPVSQAQPRRHCQVHV